MALLAVADSIKHLCRSSHCIAGFCRHHQAGFGISDAERQGHHWSHAANEVASVAEKVDGKELKGQSKGSRRGKSKRFPQPTPRDWAVLQGKLTYDEPEIQATAWYYALQKVLDNRSVVVNGTKVWSHPRFQTFSGKLCNDRQRICKAHIMVLQNLTWQKLTVHLRHC